MYAMSNTILFIILAAAFVAFVIFLLQAARGGGEPASRIPQRAGDVMVKVTREEDGINILVYNSYEDRPSDAELFPEITNDLAPAKGSLDRAFWERVADMGNIADPAERERLVSILADHGFIDRDAASTWSMPDPGVPAGDRPDGDDPGPEDFDIMEDSGEGEYFFDI